MSKASELKKLIDEGERLFAAGEHEEAQVVTNQIRRGMADMLEHIGKRVNGDFDKRLDRLEAKIKEIGSAEHLEKNLNEIGKNLLWRHKWKLILFGAIPAASIVHLDWVIKLIAMIAGGG